MNKLSMTLLTLFLTISVSAMAYGSAEISGTISYAGAQEGELIVAVFDRDFSDNNIEPVYMGTLDSPGDYTLSDIADGTYFLVSVLFTKGMDGYPQKTDPFGVYGTWGDLTPVTIRGGESVSGINITLIDGSEETPNPFYVEEEQYRVKIYSHHVSWGNDYLISFEVMDSDETAISVEVVGPGITGSMKLDFDSGAKSWSSYASGGLHFSDNPPTPPLVYTFTVVDSDSTTVKTSSVEKFTESATNLSPSIDAPATDPLSFSWTEFGPGHTYQVELVETNGNLVWTSDFLQTTPVMYDGPDLIPGAEYHYIVTVWDGWNSSSTDESFIYQSDVTGIAHRPSTFNLSQNFPNPFNPNTTITFTLPQSCQVTLKVYSVTGAEVATLIEGDFPAGMHSADWNAGENATGVYFYKLQTSGFTETRKMLLLR